MVDVGLAVFTPQSKLVVYWKSRSGEIKTLLFIHYLFDGINLITHTDYHASADVTELWFLAVVVLEFVRFVINPDDRLLRFWFLLLHLNLLLIYKIDLYIYI